MSATFNRLQPSSKYRSSDAERDGLETVRRTREQAWLHRKNTSLLDGAAAFERLLTLAIDSETGQAEIAAKFIGASLGYQAFDMYDLRVLDENISDDILACLNTIRWGRYNLQDIVVGGLGRAEAVCEAWGFKPGSASKEG